MNNAWKSWEKQSEDNKERSKHELERIVKLHNLIKKQTILVVTVIITDITLGIASTMKPELTNLNGWNIMVNAICVWLMIDTSKRYWNVCRRYGLCLICYRTSNEMGL